MFSWKQSYISYLNLDHRIDRLIHIEQELLRVGLKAERTRGKLPNEFDLFAPHLQVLKNRTPGAIGCYYGQLEIMKKALEIDTHAFVIEDDVVFGTDMQERLDYIERFVNEKSPDVDIIWLGGTFHVNPPHWHSGTNPLLLESKLGRDAELTDDPRIIRTYGAFSTHCYIVLRDSLEKVIAQLESLMHRSIGIDYSMIIMQPNLKTYSFVPGCAKQIDNKSDIGHGITIFSGFSKLNGSIENSAYWWQDKMLDFDPLKFDWHECSKR